VESRKRGQEISITIYITATAAPAAVIAAPELIANISE